MSAALAAGTEPAYPRRALASLVLIFSTFMVVLDLTVANVSVPHIAGSLGATLEQGTWVITSYAVAEAISVPLTGWLTQRFGAVRLYLAAMTGFALFSLLCGLSVTLQMLVIFRVLQGLCGGLVMPLAQTLLLRIYPRSQHNKAMMLWSSTILIAPALGPNLGGYISDNWSWHWIFLINIPLAIVLVGFGSILLRPAETQTRKVPIDKVGLGLLVFWIACLQLMLDLGRVHDWFQDPMILLLAIGAGVGFLAFLIWELTEEHPIVDIRIFRHRGFTFGVVALSLCFGGYFASLVVIPQWLQTWMGYSAADAGMIVGFTAMAAITTSRFSGKAMNHFDPRLLVCCAVAWLGCMSVMRSNWTSEADFWAIATPQILQGFAMTFFILPLTTISIGSVEPDEVASAAGLQNFVRTISLGIATALSVTIWDSTQRAAQSEMAANLQADDTLASLQASGLPLEQARQIIANLVEREASIVGLDYLFLLSAVAFFLSAAAIWLTPKPRSPGVGSAGGH